MNKWKLRRYLVGLCLSGWVCTGVRGQSASAEICILNDSWSMAGTIAITPGKDCKLGFASVNRFSADYRGQNEKFLSMNNISYAWNENWKITGGFIYMKGVECKPSLGGQFLINKRRFQMMIYPDLNVGKDLDMMLLSMLQYNIREGVKNVWFIRSQGLSWFTLQDHLFSTFRLRLGTGIGKWQFGIADNLDFGGDRFCYGSSYGIFCQKVF